MNRRHIRLLAIAVAAASATLLPAMPAGAQSLPISDPKASGAIGLCNEKLQPISSGSLASTPFVWRAVGATAAPGAWSNTGRTATLYAYQPRPSVPAAEWSGIQLTSSGHYSNPAHPMAQATRADTSLAEFVAEFPPEVDGLIELRLYLGGPQLPLYAASYDVTIIRVTGRTWTVVQGGSVDCSAGTSVSPETVLLPSSVVDPPPTPTRSDTASGATAAASSITPVGLSATAGTTRSAAASAGGDTTPAAGSASVAGVSPSLAASTRSSSTTSAALGWGVVGVLVPLLALGAWLTRRRRRST